ncbi:hypothetical protein HU200_047803 [Digitaria exilis]|uniref:Uncharacterized protein n=1 Tax=Digitaria exilis TaxID=1010633 RepID=A0A835EDM7_9POAL|nr:hypothetical protein HU200_047803 [Digitaria exilis]
MFGDKEVTILRIKEPDKIPWSKTRADYIVTACADESDADYYKVCLKI